MTDTLKVLGQSIPQAGILSTLYTVPAVTSTTISSITMCNQNSDPTSVRVSIAIAGAVDTSAQYIYYDIPISGNRTYAATFGITLAAADVVRCQSNNGFVSFNLFGVELT